MAGEREELMTPKRPSGDVSSPDKSRFLLYTTEDGGQRIEVRLETGSVWLSQKLMGDLFQVGVNTINHHVKGIYADGELSPGATIRRYRIVQKEWIAKLDAFLKLNEREVLKDAGRISADMAQ